jgi:PKD repeat protein
MKRQVLGFTTVLFLFAGVSCYKKESIPVANFTIHDRNDSIVADTVKVIPDTLTFVNLSQNASSYAWDFGDNQASTETNPIHIFTAAGSYSILLKAYSKSGQQWAMKSRTIVLHK